MLWFGEESASRGVRENWKSIGNGIPMQWDSHENSNSHTGNKNKTAQIGIRIFHVCKNSHNDL